MDNMFNFVKKWCGLNVNFADPKSKPMNFHKFVLDLGLLVSKTVMPKLKLQFIGKILFFEGMKFAAPRKSRVGNASTASTASAVGTVSTVTAGFKSIMARPFHSLVKEFKREQLAILSTMMPQTAEPKKAAKTLRGMHRTRLSVRPSDASSRATAQWTPPRLRRGRRKMITPNSVQ